MNYRLKQLQMRHFKTFKSLMIEANQTIISSQKTNKMGQNSSKKDLNPTWITIIKTSQLRAAL
jgi:hypothetical protein